LSLTQIAPPPPPRRTPETYHATTALVKELDYIEIMQTGKGRDAHSAREGPSRCHPSIVLPTSGSTRELDGAEPVLVAVAFTCTTSVA
jgi:hypothetical protein